MPKSEAAKTHHSAAITPALRHTTPWRVVSVEACPGQRLRVEFVDGTTGEVELGTFLRSPSVDGTLFAALRDSAVFEAATVVMGAVLWPNGADLAPDARYDAIRASGRWVPTAPQR